MPLATQVLWGWLFSQPMGFSFTTLRVSTLVLAWAATLGSYSLLRLSGAVPTMACAGAAIVALCPVVFPLAFHLHDRRSSARVRRLGARVRAALRERRGRPAYLAGAMRAARRNHARQADGHRVRDRRDGRSARPCRRPRRERPGRGGVSRRACGRALRLRPVSALHRHPLGLQPPRGADSPRGSRIRACSPAWSFTPQQVRTSTSDCSCCLRCRSSHAPRCDRLAAVAAFAAPCGSAAYVVKYGVRMPLFGNVLHDIGLSPILVARADLWPHAPARVWMAVTIAAGSGGGRHRAPRRFPRRQRMGRPSACACGPRRRVVRGVPCAALRGRFHVRSVSRSRASSWCSHFSPRSDRFASPVARIRRRQPRARRRAGRVRHGRHERSVFVQPRHGGRPPTPFFERECPPRISRADSR